MLSDTIDEHELATGRREEGLFFAARSFALQASFGFGAFFSGIAPQVVKFPKGTSTANIPAEAFTNLAIFARPVSLLLTLSTILISRKYDLHQDKNIEIRKAIMAR